MGGVPASGKSAARRSPPYSVKGLRQSIARIATGTGKGPVEELVKQRRLANEGIDAANVKAQGQYPEDRRDSPTRIVSLP